MIVDGDTYSRMARATAIGREFAEDTAVILVINVRDATRLRSDYSRHSVTASFLRAEELDALIIAFRSQGFYVQHFAEEPDFIGWAHGGGFDRLGLRHRLVYTSAVNGTGPGRRCLVPAYCALERIPTMNSDAYACAINRHKYHCNRLLGALGVNVPASWCFDPRSVAGGWWRGQKPAEGQRVIAKATYEGSSVGVTEDGCGPWSPKMEELVRCLAGDLRQPITVQRFVDGHEVEVPVMELGEVLAPVPLVMLDANGNGMNGLHLTYDGAWADGFSYCDPSCLGTSSVAMSAAAAIDVVKALGFHGFTRIDLRLDGEGIPYVIDVSTTPHLTTTCAYAKLFSAVGLGYGGLAAALAGASLVRHGIARWA